MKKMNYGVIGTGYFGKELAKIMNEVDGAQVTCVYDPYHGEEVAKELGCQVEEVLEYFVAREDIDAVIVASPNYLHKEHVMAALRHKKHIFCEKPIALDLTQIDDALTAVEAAGVTLQVGFNRRFDPGFAAVRQAVIAGKVGQPEMVRITSRDPEPPPIGYVRVSGGIFLDMTIHDFDMARYLTGSDVEEVYAKGAILVDPQIGEAGDFDTAVITLKFADGSIGVIDNSRKAAYGYDQRVEVFGSKGSAAAFNEKPTNVEVSTEDGVCTDKPLYFFLERYMGSFAQELQDFVTAVLEDKEPPVTGKDGLEALYIAIAATQSAKTGRPVQVSEVR